ncbi:hypothetical protein [Methylobacterium oxalidis]|uniref:hypothetical protein n=1 Tax=Methylobacterium oxalidis TaxID=944322 RepID=UPI003315E204
MPVRASRIRPALLILASACFVAASTAHASAGGLEGLFQQLVSTPQSTPQPVPVAPTQAYRGGYGDGGYGNEVQRHWRRSARRRAEPSVAGQNPSRSRGALRSRSETGSTATQGKAKVAENKAAVLAKAGHASTALMQDSTLRKGDIVITAAGPKVFTGSQKEQHSAADFEDARRSPSLDGKTRELLTQMTAPAGVATATQAGASAPRVTAALAALSLTVASIR